MTELLEWSKLLRLNFNVLLLFLGYLALVICIFHASHHAADGSHVAWLREGASGFMAGMLGFLTGRSTPTEPKETRKP